MDGALYRYTARNIDGEVVRGSVQALDVESVLAMLRTRALYVTRIDRETALRRSLSRSLLRGVPTRRARLAFFRSFSTLIHAGVPLHRAIEVAIERTTDVALREALRAVAADIERGLSLSDAVARRPLAFPRLYTAMIRAGEVGGILDEVLERLASFLERDADLHKKLRAALAYPTVVLIAAVALVIFLLLRIVPMFAQMFDAFHVEPPLTTKVLLSSSSLLESGATWAVFAIIASAATAGIAVGLRNPRTALAFDHARLHAPVVGPLLRKVITARITRTLGTLLRSGVELLAAVECARGVAGSLLYGNALLTVDRALRDGETLAAPIAASRLFDPLAVALVCVGEESGCVDDMLLKVAAYFETDVEAAIATLGAVVEPALIGILGLIVGFIVFSIFIPLYSLIGSVGK
jgi:type IV pilus assembly protein PilC